MVPFLYNLPIFQPFLPGLALINSRNEFNNRPREENRGEIVSAMIPRIRRLVCTGLKRDGDGSTNGKGWNKFFSTLRLIGSIFSFFFFFFFFLLSVLFPLSGREIHWEKRKINGLY